MSGYDSAVIGLEIIEHPDLLDLPRTVRLVFIEALVWSRAHLTNGAISRTALRRLTDEEDPERAARQLVKVKRWRTTPNGWQIIGFGDELGQDSAEKVRQRRADNAERMRDFRARKRASNAARNAARAPTDRPTDLPNDSVGSREEDGSASGQEPGPAVREGDSVECRDYLRHQSSHVFMEGRGFVCLACDAQAREAVPA